ncbi:hypothetical protein EV126DRAFT_434278 [Verticillium dahliae]|nr:hypothetical protein EV126DRAFT_434278 [Verticillium dahliae]
MKFRVAAAPLLLCAGFISKGRHAVQIVHTEYPLWPPMSILARQGYSYSLSSAAQPLGRYHSVEVAFYRWLIKREVRSHKAMQSYLGSGEKLQQPDMWHRRHTTSWDIMLPHSLQWKESIRKRVSRKCPSHSQFI